MPKGKPKAQTIATNKYQKKIGLIAKSFKIKRTVADQFRDACQKAGVSQAAKITELMLDFVDQVNKEQ